MSGHDDYARVAACELVNPDGEWLVLFLHGLGGDRRQALAMAEGFSRPELTLLAPDLRAHGETPLIGTAGDFTFDALVADIVELVTRLGQHRKPVGVAGISMGAALALRLALHDRLDVRGMAIVRPAFNDTPVPSNLTVMPVLARLLRDDDRNNARETLLASPEYQRIAAVTASGAQSVLDQLTKPHARERAIRLAEVPKNVAWRDADELRDVGVPAVVVGTDRDVMHPLALAHETAEILPDARLAEVIPRDIDRQGYDRAIRNAVQEHLAAVIDTAG